MNEIDQNPRTLLAKTLRSTRKAAHLTQMGLSERSSVSQQFISQLERGHVTVTVDTLAKLAKALNVPLYLMLKNPDF